MAEYLTVSPDGLAQALGSITNRYDQGLINNIKAAAKESAEQMAADTKATAPSLTGKYKSAITSEVTNETSRGLTATWGVKGRKGNLSHLLERGHLTKSGTRTKAFGFIASALDKALDHYLDAAEKAVGDAAK